MERGAPHHRYCTRIGKELETIVSASWYFLGFGVLFYVTSTLWESVFHEYYLDARPYGRLARFQHRRWLTDFWFGCFSHGSLHHYLTFRQCYTKQFSSAAEKDRLMERLAEGLTPSQLRAAAAGCFGNTMPWSQMLYFGVPIYINFLWLAVAPGPTEAIAIALANAVFATPYLICSKFVHPFLHDRYGHAIARASWPIRIVLRSRYGLEIRVSHFVHHRHPSRNFNLQIGGDLMRRRWLPPSDADWADMMRLGIVEPEHKQRLLAYAKLGHRFRAG